MRTTIGVRGAERHVSADRLFSEEARLRTALDSRPLEVARAEALRAGGSQSAATQSDRAHAFVPRQQAEIGEPLREIDVTPLEEPVPDVAPIEEPDESPVGPVREPERVPA